MASPQILLGVRGVSPPFDATSGQFTISGSCGSATRVSDVGGKLIDGNWQCSNSSGGTMDNLGSPGWVQGHVSVPQAGNWALVYTFNFIGVYLCCDGSRYTDIYITASGVTGKLWDGNTNGGSISFGPALGTFQTPTFYLPSSGTLSWTVSFYSYTSIPCCNQATVGNEVTLFLNTVSLVQAPSGGGGGCVGSMCAKHT